tara:strand:- start:9733 stop:10587 length:855 start_codon:yes stop_codon:yes gene_type:complete
MTDNSISTAIPKLTTTLSIVAIAKNEIVDIKGFIEHVKGWASEIIVVDDQSTDGTAKFLEDYGPPVKCISRALERIGGFAAQRNAGAEIATSEWLLHMDIDERVPAALAREISQAITNTQFNAFRYRRLNFFLHRPFRAGGWQFWNAAQLCRRNAHRFVNAVHEITEIDGGETKIGQLHEEMWHLNDDSFAERLRKNAQYAALSAEEINTPVSWVDIFLRPAFAALKAYFWHGAWRQGTLGFLFSVFVFVSKFNRYAIAWDKQTKIDRQKLEAEISKSWSSHVD